MENYLVEKQPILSKILSNIKKNKRIAHAYILVGDNKNKLEEYSTLFSKVLICPNNYEKTCEICNICKDLSSYISVKQRHNRT